MKLTELRGKIVSESVITDVKKSNQVMGVWKRSSLGTLSASWPVCPWAGNHSPSSLHRLTPGLEFVLTKGLS